jgi:hypothetical protein
MQNGEVAMDRLVNAIVEDDRARVKKLLKREPQLARSAFEEPRLFEAKIFHWIYVNDMPLHLAAAGHRVEIGKLLLAAGAEVNAMMNHRVSGPLHYAADGNLITPDWNAERQVKMIVLLLDAGAEIDAQDKNGATPLHRAVRTRCAAAVRCLLERGANTSLRNKNGSLASDLATRNTGRGGSGTEVAKLAQGEIIAVFKDRLG